MNFRFDDGRTSLMVHAIDGTVRITTICPEDGTAHIVRFEEDSLRRTIMALAMAYNRTNTSRANVYFSYSEDDDDV